MSTRRQFLALLAGGGAATFAVAGLPGAVFAGAPGERRLVVVLLRGALDGLAAAPPLGDARYAERRGALVLAPPGEADGALPLDGFFGLHPALAAIHPYWAAGEFLLVPAAGNGYRTRSHFEAQDLMESGLAAKRAEGDGWLNRALALMDPRERRDGLAVGGAVPLILRGAVPVAAWEPAAGQAVSADFMTAVAALYRADPLLGPALAEGLRAQDFAAGVLGDGAAPGGRGFGPQVFPPLAAAAGRLLAADAGPRVAVLEMGGWDTHANEGAAAGRLARNLAGLGEGLAALAQGLGAAWRQTVVVTVTEFGRTVTPNGNGGTDHGTASLLLVMGGAVRGGRVVGDWPGLERLEDGRDLRVATDARRVMAGILRDHFGLDAGDVARRVFPDAPALPPVADLLRA